MIIQFLFWFSVFAVFYSYIGYPVFLWLVSFVKEGKRGSQSGNAAPKVSLLISVYNEEGVIEEKLVNSLGLDYPKDLLEIVVISDGSTDRTDEIVARYASQGVLLRSYEGRIGKTACLNKTVPSAKGEIIVFSDANSKYDRSAVKRLVSHFSDPQIGFVTGATRYISEEGGKLLDSIGIYSKIEKVTKMLESRTGSCVGADGAIFAIRKSLYQPLQSADINDLVIPLNIIRKGLRGIVDENAFCIEKIAKGAKGEFNRQVRITNRTLRALVNQRDLLNPFKYGFFPFELFSHKVIRMFVPFFLLKVFVLNLFLLGQGPLYVGTFFSQLFFYSLSALGYSGRLQDVSRLVSMSHTFVVVNGAVFVGWIKYLNGDTYTTWTTAREGLGENKSSVGMK
jgi:cellulose synthase/poly-beta-1,6-N-acetylglucosamine synthase-like glycosyltransferase